ncbi:TetR/AcrR family transcriptional regulator [Exilibacterium tricleocarpae]|uniref:TetR/AcrR family transcriptional regulator n=1 Tax=Exilibacterium tricleocarpae TaxID=2591008 RepID=A0A545TVN1_9GAMM|nr:TetR/AcrR family transcriptional regulator [Exilibacterium tricleocarpae]TQV81211.1 TetR/AcrR family transcriptional regulator [Exilibacterium tricleocarpae]
MTRDRKKTERQLIDAAGRVLARDGFRKFGVNAIAREAGLDKVLIYRYFDGLPGLVRAYALQGDFWPDIDELIGEPTETFLKKPFADQLALLMENYAAAIRRRPLTMQILAWEILDRNELTVFLEEIREQMSIKLGELLSQQTGTGSREENPVDTVALTAIFAASINYLAARSLGVDIFNGIDIQTDDGWKRITDMIRRICKKTF